MFLNEHFILPTLELIFGNKSPAENIPKIGPPVTPTNVKINLNKVLKYWIKKTKAVHKIPSTRTVNFKI